MPVMMRGPSRPVMMREPIVRQLRGDLLYARHGEGTYCTPIKMRGPIVRPS